MSILTEKRAELMSKLEKLELARKVEIDEKTYAYRMELEKTIPTDAIDAVKKVIVAIDEVIAYDTIDTPAETIAVEAVAQPVESQSARPGMASVITPSRQ